MSRVMVLAGDGVGPEVTAQAVRVLEAASRRFDVPLVLHERLVGGASIEQSGVAVSDDTMRLCSDADAVLFGAVGGLAGAGDGGPRPEEALFRLRTELELFANIRPVRTLGALLGSSPLREERVREVDLVIVRELSAGLYYGFHENLPGKPSEIREDGDETVAIDTLRYTEGEIARVVDVAFRLAEQRRHRVTSVDKANVLSSSILWRRVVDAISTDFPAVECEHLLVDACAMALLARAASFDVIVTENLFGDILTDEASMLAGSLGMLPSASVGTRRTQGGLFGLYEPVHGSAPDIAGQDTANPCGAILSAAMLLRHSLGRDDAANAVEKAVTEVFDAGYRTADLSGGRESVGTARMGELVEERVLAC